MIRFAPVLGLALLTAPSAASAALTLQIGPNQGPDQVDAVLAPGSGEHFFDLTFTDSPPTRNDYLYGYDLRLTTAQPGIRLVRMEKPDNWVLPPDGSFVQMEADAGHVQGQGVTNARGELLDITTGGKAG